MIDLVVICVYDRVINLKRWLKLWAKCEQTAQLVVISGYQKGHTVNVPYFQRPNQGMDIGKFQDVVLGRVPDFPDWNTMLWVNDDCFPVQPDFLSVYNKALEDESVGVACMCISPYVREHIRTTGYAIRKEVAQNLYWPVDPIMTREDCLNYEHTDPDNHLLQQVRNLGYKAVQVAPDRTSPMIDLGYPRRDRRREMDFIRFEKS